MDTYCAAAIVFVSQANFWGAAVTRSVSQATTFSKWARPDLSKFWLLLYSVPLAFYSATIVGIVCSMIAKGFLASVGVLLTIIFTSSLVLQGGLEP